MVESLFFFEFSALSTTLSPTVTSWSCPTPTEQPLSLTQESNGTLQSPLSSISSQVLDGPTWDVRTQTRPLCSVPPTHTTLRKRTPPRNSPSRSFCSCVLPNTPSGAQFHYVFMKTTQLSFAEFLESCNLSSSLPPCPNPSTTLLLEAATQIPSHCAAFADATTELPLTKFFLGCIHSKDPLDRSGPSLAHGNVCTTCSRPIPTLLLDAAAQTPPQGLLLPMRRPNSRSRSSFSGASTPKILWIARSHHRHMDLPTAPHFPNPVTSLPSTVSAVPAAPADLVLVHRFHERGSTLRHRRHQVSRIKLPSSLIMGSL